MVADYIKQLNKMYNDKYYIGQQSKCKFFNQCSSKINEPLKFCSDRLKIGEKYGEKYNGKDIPKIVFCGLEGTHNDIKNNSDKHIPDIDLEKSSSKPSRDATNNHYRGVRYVLSYILSGVLDISKPLNAKIDELSEDKYVDFLNYYCLTNMYHCAFSDRTSKLPHSREMKNNCINIFFDEIDTLKPDLVVIQVVSNCPKEFWSKMKEKYHYEGTEDKPIKCAKRNGMDNTNTSLYKLMYDDLTPFYCLWTYHGNGAPYGNKESRFVNNQKYITEELNPVLDSTITELKSIL